MPGSNVPFCNMVPTTPGSSLQDKLQALIDRAVFMPSFLTGASLQVCVAVCRQPCASNRPGWLTACTCVCCTGQGHFHKSGLAGRDALVSAGAGAARQPGAGGKQDCSDRRCATHTPAGSRRRAEFSCCPHLVADVCWLALLPACVQVVLPRPQPRVPADRLQQHLQQALQDAGVSTDSSGGGGSSSGGSDQPFTVVS